MIDIRAPTCQVGATQKPKEKKDF